MEGDPRFKEILSTFDKSPNGYYFEDSFSYFEDCFKDSCYVFMASGFTWMFNRDYCRDCGVDLVSIETEEEWFFIDGEIRNRYTAEWYIGLEKKERNWTWVSERPVTISKWRANQPSNNNKVAFIIRESDSSEQGISTDPAGTDPKAFICEMPKGKTNLRLLSAQ